MHMQALDKIHVNLLHFNVCCIKIEFFVLCLHLYTNNLYT